MIVVLVETTPAGEAVEVSREAITFARSLAAEGGGVPVDAVVVGEPSAELVATLAAYGVRTVHALTGEAFASYAGAAWACRRPERARLVRGRDGRRHAARQRGDGPRRRPRGRGDGRQRAVVQRARRRSWSPARWSAAAALEEMRLADRPAVFTVAGHAVEAVPAETPGPAEVQVHTPEIAAADLVARVVSSEEPEPDLSGTLKSARVVVGAGRGAGSSDGFADLLELTELVGGSLGVSRVVTSLGWRPHHEQVGQTGSRISPDLYIPCGISGAIQHWAGCSSAKTILAINTDPDAPMVTKASYAVIGDLHEVVPGDQRRDQASPGRVSPRTDGGTGRSRRPRRGHRAVEHGAHRHQAAPHVLVGVRLRRRRRPVVRDLEQPPVGLDRQRRARGSPPAPCGWADGPRRCGPGRAPPRSGRARRARASSSSVSSGPRTVAER